MQPRKSVIQLQTLKLYRKSKIPGTNKPVPKARNVRTNEPCTKHVSLLASHPNLTQHQLHQRLRQYAQQSAPTEDDAIYYTVQPAAQTALDNPSVARSSKRQHQPDNRQLSLFTEESLF